VDDGDCVDFAIVGATRRPAIISTKVCPKLRVLGGVGVGLSRRGRLEDRRGRCQQLRIACRRPSESTARAGENAIRPQPAQLRAPCAADALRAQLLRQAVEQLPLRANGRRAWPLTAAPPAPLQPSRKTDQPAQRRQIRSLHGAVFLTCWECSARPRGKHEPRPHGLLCGGTEIRDGQGRPAHQAAGTTQAGCQVRA